MQRSSVSIQHLCWILSSGCVSRVVWTAAINKPHDTDVVMIGINYFIHVTDVFRKMMTHPTRRHWSKPQDWLDSYSFWYSYVLMSSQTRSWNSAVHVLVVTWECDHSMISDSEGVSTRTALFGSSPTLYMFSSICSNSWDIVVLWLTAERQTLCCKQISRVRSTTLLLLDFCLCFISEEKVNFQSADI